MANDQNKQGQRLSKADAMITNYLDDLFVTDPLSDSAENASLDGPRTVMPAVPLGRQSIDAGYRLVTTLNPGIILRSGEMPKKGQAFLLALTGLYYLRRPLSPKLRQHFLSLTESMLDSYASASWKESLTRKGVLSEARQR